MSEVSENINKRLFMGNLPSKVSPHQLADALVGFTETSVTVFNSGGRSRSGTFAFVTFKNAEDLEKGLESLKDLKLNGRTVTVERAEPGKRKEQHQQEQSETKKSNKSETETLSEANKSESAGTAESKESSKPAKGRPTRRQLPVSDDSVYISNVPLEVTNEEILELFEGFENPKVTIITKEARKRRQGSKLITLAPKSYAFVKVGKDAQEKAIKELDGKQWKENELKVSKATVSPEDIEEE